MIQTCPACGASNVGKFCPECGARIGAPVSGRERERRAWWIAGVFGFLSMGVVFVLVAQRNRPAASSEGPGSLQAGSLAGLEALTARERFDSLYNRVMRSAENGDTATVSQLAAAVFQAYSQLETVDADARYHAAVLRLHVLTDTTGALRLADSILAAKPKHLFGFLIRGTVARFTGDERLLRRASAEFLQAWPAEMAAARPEYGDHQTMLDQFRKAAMGY